MTVTIEQAQASLPELIAKVALGEEIVITRRDQRVAKLVAERILPLKPRRPGSAKGKLIIVKDDDDHLVDFAGYIP